MLELKNTALSKLNNRGVDISSIGIIVYNLQKKYNHDITINDCLEAINSVLNKREVIHTILTGIALDECAEQNLLDHNINQIIKNDDSLYGIDEILALGIVNIYGTIALTSFGYLDKTKPGIVGILDTIGKNKTQCHTFLDDIVCAIAAAAASKIAHSKK
jgi:phosphatidylglycerophosphatase A